MESIAREGYDTFERLCTVYLNKVYDNVDSYKVNTITVKDDTIYIEGNIKFKSGANAVAPFEFKYKNTYRNEIYLIGGCLYISGDTKAFKMNCSVEGDSLIIDSLTYNYRPLGKAKNDMIYGKVERIKKCH